MRARTSVLALAFTLLASAGCKNNKLTFESVNPPSGRMGGNEEVRIRGTGFGQLGNLQDVRFGGRAATNVGVQGDDTIVLTGHAFRGLGAGVLADAAFRDVGEAASADDRIVYRANGTLSFDPDGRGGAAAHIFAKLAGAPDVSAGDILIA